MAYDESLLERVRALVGAQPGYVEKKMFGGVAMMLDGNMACGAMRDGLLVRADPSRTEELLTEPGVHPFEMGGRTGRGWVVVEPETYADDDVLESWVGIGAAYARTLPPK